MQQTLTDLGGLKRQQHGLPIDEEYFECVVLQHVTASVYLNDLGVLPGEKGGFLVRWENLCDVGVPQWLVTDEIAADVGCRGMGVGEWIQGNEYRGIDMGKWVWGMGIGGCTK